MIDEKKLIEELKQSGMIADNEYGNAMVAMIKNQPKIGNWIPCSKRMPESERDVEITCVSKHLESGEPLCFTVRAFYEDGTINTNDSCFSWEDTDNWEYDEEKDGYVIPEGWFESVTFAEEFGAIDLPVIAWREITDPYKPKRMN